MARAKRRAIGRALQELSGFTGQMLMNRMILDRQMKLQAAREASETAQQKATQGAIQSRESIGKLMEQASPEAIATFLRTRDPSSLIPTPESRVGGIISGLATRKAPAEMAGFESLIPGLLAKEGLEAEEPIPMTPAPGMPGPRTQPTPYATRIAEAARAHLSGLLEEETRAGGVATARAGEQAESQAYGQATGAERAAGETFPSALGRQRTATGQETELGLGRMKQESPILAERAGMEEAARLKARGTGAEKILPSEYQTALDRAIMSVPAVRRGTVVEAANRLWREGNEAELKQIIRQAAIEGEPATVRTQIVGRQATLASLADTRQILEQLEAVGIPTNWFTGNVEDLVRKLGTTQNPAYVELANRLMGTLINYRRAATGVQFSVIESKDYQRMFPNYRNTLPVNLGLIRGLEREMRTYDRAFWEHKLGSSGAALIGVLPGEPQEQLKPLPSHTPTGLPPLGAKVVQTIRIGKR